VGNIFMELVIMKLVWVLNSSTFFAIGLKLAPMFGVALANFSRMLDFGFEVQTSSSLSFASFSFELSISSTFHLFPPTLCGD
jgi:hypothetical protein